MCSWQYKFGDTHAARSCRENKIESGSGSEGKCKVNCEYYIIIFALLLRLSLLRC